MTRLMIVFRQPLNPATFERRYAGNLALLKQMPGVRMMRAGHVLGGPSGESPFFRTVEVYFDSFEALDAALISPEGVAAGKDLMDFAADRIDLLFLEDLPDGDTLRPLTPKDLQAYLDEHEIPAEIVYPDLPTPTVPAAAQALGVAVDQIVKSLVFLVDGRPFVVYGCGTRRVDPRKLAARLNVNRKQVQFADADQVLELTGYEAGTVPPFGFKMHIPAFMDPAVQAHEEVYAGGGGINALVKIKSADLLRATDAQVVPLLADPTETPASDEA
ncbi:MAG: EthD family reductase [Chloroflexi bacterium]|nr:EthD family reductase [Chloroflexota bacterium]